MDQNYVHKTGMNTNVIYVVHKIYVTVERRTISTSQYWVGSFFHGHSIEQFAAFWNQDFWWYVPIYFTFIYCSFEQMRPFLYMWTS